MAAQVAGYSLSTLHLTPPLGDTLPSPKGVVRGGSLRYPVPLPPAHSMVAKTRASLRALYIQDEAEMRESSSCDF